jgi:hypothetical protein
VAAEAEILWNWAQAKGYENEKNHVMPAKAGNPFSVPLGAGFWHVETVFFQDSPFPG